VPQYYLLASFWQGTGGSSRGNGAFVLHLLSMISVCLLRLFDALIATYLLLNLLLDHR
jgi:hypothetical protein